MHRIQARQIPGWPWQGVGGVGGGAAARWAIGLGLLPPPPPPRVPAARGEQVVQAQQHLWEAPHQREVWPQRKNSAQKISHLLPPPRPPPTACPFSPSRVRKTSQIPITSDH